MTRAAILTATLAFGGFVTGPYLVAQTPAPAPHGDHALPATHPPVGTAAPAASAVHAKLVAHMKAADAKVDALMAKAAAARGDAKVDALLDVITALRDQQKMMHDGMMEMHTAMHGAASAPMSGAR
jgi:hypothetical protein